MAQQPTKFVHGTPGGEYGVIDNSPAGNNGVKGGPGYDTTWPGPRRERGVERYDPPETGANPIIASCIESKVNNARPSRAVTLPEPVWTPSVSLPVTVVENCSGF